MYVCKVPLEAKLVRGLLAYTKVAPYLSPKYLPDLRLLLEMRGDNPNKCLLYCSDGGDLEHHLEKIAH
jgi:hypothetical protein